ncbi:MAG: hypothetical protein ABEN55_19220, partial [Bradymonadaceae bacterium]
VAGGILAASGLVDGTAVVSGGWGMIRAWATEFRFDEQGAHEVFDLISRNETQFALERITSVSVFRNPLDWIAGTMTVRFRSIGSDEDLDFWGIEHDADLIDDICRHLGIVPVPCDDLAGELPPDYTVLDGLKAPAGLNLTLGALLTASIIAVAALDLPTGGVLPITLAILTGLVLLAHQVWRAIIHGRIRGTLFDDHVEIAGGILRRYRHIAPLDHVKAVESRRYPGSDAGRLTFKTAGFPIDAGHLPEVVDLHRRVDERLADTGRAEAPALEAGDVPASTFRPSATTEILRYAWLLLVGIGLVVLPYVFIYYRRVDYTVESGRLVADAGLYFARRTTVLVGRVDHIESNRKFVQYLTGTHNIQVFTVGNRECDLVIRSLSTSSGALELIRERLADDET